MLILLNEISDLRSSLTFEDTASDPPSIKHVEDVWPIFKRKNLYIKTVPARVEHKIGPNWDLFLIA